MAVYNFRPGDSEHGASSDTHPSSRSDNTTNGNWGRFFADSQQVFVGNLPGDISDLRLKRFFNRKLTCLEMWGLSAY